MTDKDAAVLRELTRVLWDSRVWKVRLNIEHCFEQGMASELYSPTDLDEICLDFHKPLAIPEKIRRHQRIGSVWINVRNCGVRVRHGKNVLMNSGDSTSRILSLLPTLVGSRLVNVAIDCPAGDARFVFEDERSLICFPASSRNGINWVIESEAGNEIELGPGMRIGYRSGLR
jgi:hypothetical protein